MGWGALIAPWVHTVCDWCEVHNWKLYCLEEARKANCKAIPSPPSVGAARAYNLGRLFEIEGRSGKTFRLTLRIPVAVLRSFPEIMDICKAAKVDLDVIGTSKEESE